MESLKSIRNRCDILLAAAVATNDKERVEILQEVQMILKNDNCFKENDEISLKYALFRLGYDIKVTNEIYDTFNNLKALPGVLEYVSEDGNIISVDVMLCPKVEDYYKFENGLIFKYDSRQQDFYYLIDGRWVYDPDIQRKFNDTGYNYQSIKYTMGKNDSTRRK